MKIFEVKNWICCKRVDCIALLEVKLNEKKCEETIVKCSPNREWKGSYSINHNGWSRILVLWNSARCEVTVVKNFSHFICCKVKSNSMTFGVTFVYASNNYAERASMWEMMYRETIGFQGSWLYTGDFNSVLCSNEKRNGAMMRDTDIQDLHNFVTQKRLVDLEQGGWFYSWNNNNKNPDNRVWCKLDRAMGNESWFDEFQDAKAMFSPPGISNHSPILISMGARETYKKHFRHCRFWEELDMYKECVEGCWRSSRPCNNLFLLQAKLKKMNETFKERFVNVTVGLDKRVEDARGNLLNIQMSVHDNPGDETLLSLETEAAKEFRKLKRYQIIFYQQRTKMQWIKDGDINSRFFHSVIKGRRSRNNIKAVRLADGSISSERNRIHSVFSNYFQSLLGYSVDPDLVCKVTISSGKLVEDEWCRGLIREATDEEIWKALNAIGVDKSPGPDGFSASFFKRNWNLIATELCNSIRHYLGHNDLPKGINSTALALIPKHNSAMHPEEYIPISCCTVVYKIIS
ncbi:hypothetical protein QQ045_005671 [Rhodiola kirilowii]